MVTPEWGETAALIHTINRSDVILFASRYFENRLKTIGFHSLALGGPVS
jgi:hypothetical protein